MLDVHQLRQQILPMLETAGLITQEQDPNDKRKILIFPTLIRKPSKNENQNNDENKGGVNNNNQNL